jgi:hypothetical protein
MTRTSRFGVAAALLCLGFSHPAAADPIRITAGSMLLTGPSELGSIVVMGTRGFSLQSSVDPLEGNTVMAGCGITPCVPGETNIGGSLLGSAFPGGVATFEGNVYNDIDNLNSPAAVGLVFSGSAVLPPVPGSPMSMMVTALFALTPESAFFVSGGRVGLTGGGTATLWLRPNAGAGDRPGWTLDQIRYDFNDTQPVPEPGTILLVATGMLGAWRFRRRPVEE